MAPTATSLASMNRTKSLSKLGRTNTGKVSRASRRALKLESRSLSRVKGISFMSRGTRVLALCEIENVLSIVAYHLKGYFNIAETRWLGYISNGINFSRERSDLGLGYMVAKKSILVLKKEHLKGFNFNPTPCKRLKTRQRCA